MAKMVLTAASVTINGTDYSDRCSKAQLAVEVEEKDVTTFASSGWVEVLGGLKSGTLALTFKNDIADNDIDEDMWGVLGTVVTFAVKLTQSAVGTSNPQYSGSVLAKSWTPLNGAVGDVAEVEVQWPTSGAVSRATA